MKVSSMRPGDGAGPPHSLSKSNSDVGGNMRPMADKLFGVRARTGSLIDQSLETIRNRLDAQLPKSVYLADSYLAAMLNMSLKTLANRRAAKPDRYPRPLHLGGARTGVHERTDLVDWLAREELRARASGVHRCS